MFISFGIRGLYLVLSISLNGSFWRNVIYSIPHKWQVLGFCKPYWEQEYILEQSKRMRYEQRRVGIWLKTRVYRDPYFNKINSCCTRTVPVLLSSLWNSHYFILVYWFLFHLQKNAWNGSKEGTSIIINQTIRHKYLFTASKNTLKLKLQETQMNSNEGNIGLCK